MSSPKLPHNQSTRIVPKALSDRLFDPDDDFIDGLRTLARLHADHIVSAKSEGRADPKPAPRRKNPRG
jgi:hypothetical protein